MRILATATCAALVLVLAGPAAALAPSGRHDNIVYLNRLKMEREARAAHEARKAEAERLDAARRAAATARAEPVPAPAPRDQQSTPPSL